MPKSSVIDPHGPVPTIFVYLYGGGVVPIQYTTLDAAASAMRCFIAILRKAPRYRKGAYVGTHTLMIDDTLGEVPTFVVEFKEIRAARLLMVRNPSQPSAPPMKCPRCGSERRDRYEQDPTGRGCIYQGEYHPWHDE